VVAVDVGYGQLDWRIRNDERVVVLERTNIRELAPDSLPWLADGLVADLSFISLRLLMPAFTRLVTPDAILLLMVKPQFEVGKDLVGRGGVVRDPELWRGAVRGVVQAAESEGWRLVDTSLSDLQGPKGNHEFFVLLRRGDDSDMESIDRAMSRVR
jgi:23S rRNA (cytidine1920-2'-O)/16S rRNA (cytidine1409-2'-O)-methyltransferase